MHNCFRSLLLVVAWFATFTVRALTFTSDTTIGFTNTNYDGADLVISNCVVTIDGPHAFASLQVLSGGSLTHTASASGLLYSQVQTNEQPVLSGTNAVALSLTNVVPGSVSVTDLSGSTVYTNGVDYLLLRNALGVTSIQRTGASGIPDGAGVSVTYSVFMLLGPSGLNLNIAGDALIEAGGVIALNGLGYNGGYGPGSGLLNGAAGTPAGGGGGHGGLGGISGNASPGGNAYDSLLQPVDKGSEGAGLSPGLDTAGGGAAQLMVGGLLRVNGMLAANGLSATNPAAGGGAGGSFWLTAQTFAGSGTVSVNGGDGEPVAGGGGAGGRIAVYCQTNTFKGLLSARGGRGAQAGGAGTLYTRVGQAVGSALVDNGGRTGGSTPLAAPEPLALTVSGGATVSVPAALTVGSLMLSSNGWLSVTHALLTVTNDASIGAGCGITADGTGYVGGTGPGAGGYTALSGYTQGNGAGHGGAGVIVAGVGSGSACYDSVSQPTQTGSGGGRGNGAAAYFGGAGGGAIRLTVGGTLTLDGALSANGGAGIGQASGGGAGGSIWVTAGTLGGAGTISANGGAGNDIGGSGGGGCIALYYQNWNFAGVLKAMGAGGGTNVGGAGTIYTKANAQATGQLLLDNGGVLATAVSTFSAAESLALTVQGGAIAAPSTSQMLSSLLINTNGWLRITNSVLTVQGNGTVQAGGGIVADGTGFASGIGTGAGRSISLAGGYYGSGGGHGGLGGFGGSSGLTYDSVSSPSQMGSGGGNAPPGNAYGGAGGGAIRLTVTGTLTVNGRVSADGAVATGPNGGGGSGGCVALSAGTLAGSGLISATGGAALDGGGGGGGGRIALSYNASAFTGTVRAWGGPGAANGGAGTIYSRLGQATAQVLLDNGGAVGGGSDLTSAGTIDLILRGSAIVSNYAAFPLLNNLTISSNCWLILNSQSALTLNVAGNATLQAGGGIKADGAGYLSGQGSGAGRSYPGSYYTGSGGAYGGCGGAAFGGIGGGAYGASASSPLLGSGGGAGNTIANSGGAGGGSLTLRVTGVLLVDGRISVDGNPGTLGSNAGGGSGGSLYLTASVLMGSGTLSASGGAGDGQGGGGGGGRIMVFPTVNSFAGSMVAYGGNGYARGGAGTVFIQNPDGSGQLVADNGGVPGTNTLILENGTLDLTVKGAALLAPSSYSLSLRNLSIASNSWVVLSSNVLPYSFTITLSGNADIAPGGGIKADGAGYGGGSGPGAGKLYSLYPNNGGSGAGYGGAGGLTGVANGPGGAAYGSAISSPQPGSGGASVVFGTGGAGGGCLTLRVTGTLNLNGRISADGISATAASSGGGSGGSIYITAGTLAGSGTISANGGNGVSLGGGGGGGRIMLLPTADFFSGLLTAYGGNGYARGGAGTIYTFLSGQNTGSLVLDNGGLPGTNTVLGDSGVFDLTIKGGAKGAITSGSFGVRDLYVAANSWLVPMATPTILTISGNGVLEAGGGILADGLGYAAAAGPGAGFTSGSTRGGGGYGGNGGGNAGGGATYGSLQQPTQLGSGGAYYQSPSGSSLSNSAGGGAVILNVAGTLDVEGKISANGNPGLPDNGGGSGGSVYLTVGTLLGSGAISANGGNSSGNGGGGGGGRIAVLYGANSFSGGATAYGGTSAVGSGGAGTVYFTPKVSTGGSTQVIVDNGGAGGTNTSLAGLSSFTDVVIRNGGAVWAGPTTFMHNLTIQSNGWLHCGSDANTVLIGGDANIQPGGGITADGAGYLGGQGAGAGAYAGSASGSGGGGGAYGGTGGASGTGNAGGQSYGSPLAPNLPGSGGGGSAFPHQGGAGGGIVALNVTGTLQLDGRISADGAPGLAPGGGGGSGGTVNLTVTTFAGTGTVSANGGAGDSLGGGGSGGRILLRSNIKAFSGAVTAYGGAGATVGGAGTIYTPTTAQPSGLLLADNGGQNGADTPLPMLGAFDLTVQNGAMVTVASPFICLSNLLINPGGTLTAPGTNGVLELMLLGNGRIEAGGALSLDGRGYAQATGPGAGLTSAYVGSGAGYGGPGGASSVQVGGAAYGSAQQPTDAGSGGGLGWGNPGLGSEGGGALRLSVAGTLTVNGRLSANGNPGVQDDAGGGAGGSLWVDATALAGNGAISVDGGAGQLLSGGGGAGGRVAIYTGNNAFAGRLTAAGAPGYAWGADGSLYFGAGPVPLLVASQNPSGILSNTVSALTLEFSAPLNLGACLNNSQSVLTDPTGTQYAMLVYGMPDATHLQFSFPAQTNAGAYTFTVGPGIVDLFGQPMSQVYTGSFVISLPMIQGTVTDLNGQPVSGVLLQTSAGSGSSLTDTNGNFSLGVLPGTSLTVTPTLGTMAFVPGSRTFTNVTAALPNQNFLAVSTLAPTLKAQANANNLTLSWFGIPGVSYQPLWSTNLTDWYPYGAALLGTNGTVQLALPTGAEPAKFFRLRASN